MIGSSNPIAVTVSDKKT
jgi:hypothetical protein